MLSLFKKNSRAADIREIQSFIRAHKEEFEKREAEVPPDVFDVTCFFFDEILDIYASMEILMQKHHFRGCLPMARLLLENSINLQYIYKQDIEERAKQFKLKSASSYYKRFATLNDPAPEYKELKKIFEDKLEEYVPNKKTLKEKAKEVNLHSMYKDSYTRLSGYVHSEYKGNRDLSEVRPYNDYLRRMVFSDTLLVTLDALKSICEKYDLDGGVMIIDDPGYKGVVLFATNPKKQQEVV
jgi:hypothetical protein